MGTPLVQVKECGKCQLKKERDTTVRATRFVASVKSVGDSISEQGASSGPGISTLRSKSGEARDDRGLARQLGLNVLSKMPFLEWCRYQDPETGKICASPIRVISRIPKEKSESSYILGLSLRRCQIHLKQLSDEYMHNYLKLYLPKYFETYPREKRLESLRRSNAKRYGTDEHRIYMRNYLKEWRAKKRAEREAGQGTKQIETPTLHENHEGESRGAGLA